MFYISGLLRQDDGNCFIENEEVTEDNHSYKTNVGYVLETPMYIESFTADEYLEFVARLHKLDENTIKLRMQELLDFFELPTQNKKYIKNFSRGMKGKVSLAASLIHNPQYLILDEPFDGLDFLTIEKIKTLLKTKAEKGATILITSHQYDIISALCDNLALLKDGIIEFNNSYDALEKQVTEESEESVKTYLEKLMSSGEKKSLDFI